MNWAKTKHEILITQSNSYYYELQNSKSTKHDIQVESITLKTSLIVSLIEQYNGNSKSRLVKEVMHQVK